MKHLREYKKTVLTYIGLAVVIFVLSAYNYLPRVYAADTTSYSLEYNSQTNTFSYGNSTTNIAGDVGLYYKNTKGVINAVYRTYNSELPAKTCSDVCVEDTVTYGIIKGMETDSGKVESIRFRMVDNKVEIIDRSVIEYARIPAQENEINPFIALTTDEELWLKNPVDVSPTPTRVPSATPSPTVLPTKAVTPSATPSPSPTPNINPPATCKEGLSWINGAAGAMQGKQKNGLVVPSSRSNLSYAYGEPDSLFYSIGMNGWVVFTFNGDVNNVPGADISIYEVTYGRSSAIEEYARVEVSMDGKEWYALSTHARSKVNSVGINYMDFDETGLSKIRYIRMTDIPNPAENQGYADGMDINAIQGTSQSCPPPTVSPTPTVTATPTPVQEAKIEGVDMISKSCYVGSLICNPIVSLQGTNLQNVTDIRAVKLGLEIPGVFFANDTGTGITIGFPGLTINTTYSLRITFASGKSIDVPAAFDTIMP